MRPGDVSTMQAITSDPSVFKYRPSVRTFDDWIVYEGRPTEAYASSGLYTVRPGRGSPVPLTRADWYGDSSPFWSPDGRHVVFISSRSGHQEAWTVDVGTGALRQLTRGPRSVNRLSASWSPNGIRLAVLDGHQGGWSARGRLEFYDTITPLP